MRSIMVKNAKSWKRHQRPKRWQRLWVITTVALLGASFLQIATYRKIEETLVRNCGDECLQEGLPFSTLRITSFHEDKGIMDQPKELDTKQTKVSKTSIPDVKSFLIVGGSDGSGTRAIVQVLRSLGTSFLIEDPVTFDAHASEISHSSDGHVTSGWPSLIERSFSNFGREGFFQSKTPSHSHNQTLSSSNINWPPPPEALEQENEMEMANGIEADINRLIESWNDSYRDSVNRESVNRSSVSVSTRGVTYAVKAPASMLVLPIFAYLQQKESNSSQRLKFIHVIRDGRDVAFSDNQSPVIKFYNLTYPSNHPRRESLASFVSSATSFGEEKRNEDSVTHAKAMQLWNDWNVNVYRWANDPQHLGKDVDYMWIRTEDLLVSGSQERLGALSALVQFVGSTITQAELCALTRLSEIDYGQSMRTAPQSILRSRAGAEETDVMSRWKLQIRDAEKRMSQQQQQPTTRRLTEDKEMINRLGEPIVSQLQQDSRKISMVGPSPMTVRNRYGKWKLQLENKKDMREFFYQEGQEGLNLFGYHPYRQIHYPGADLPTTLCMD